MENNADILSTLFEDIATNYLKFPSKSAENNLKNAAVLLDRFAEGKFMTTQQNFTNQPTGPKHKKKKKRKWTRFEIIPDELIVELSLFAPLDTIFALMRTNKRFYVVLRTSTYFWRKIYEKTFKAPYRYPIIFEENIKGLGLDYYGRLKYFYEEPERIAARYKRNIKNYIEQEKDVPFGHILKYFKVGNELALLRIMEAYIRARGFTKHYRERFIYRFLPIYFEQNAEGAKLNTQFIVYFIKTTINKTYNFYKILNADDKRQIFNRKEVFLTFVESSKKHGVYFDDLLKDLSVRPKTMPGDYPDLLSDREVILAVLSNDGYYIPDVLDPTYKYVNDKEVVLAMLKTIDKGAPDSYVEDVLGYIGKDVKNNPEVSFLIEEKSRIVQWGSDLMDLE
jgi:hypothetical protein